MASPNEIMQASMKLNLLISQYGLDPEALMRAIGQEGVLLGTYFNPDNEVPCSVLEKLAVMFRCNNLQRFLQMGHGTVPPGMRDHIYAQGWSTSSQ